MHTRQKRAHYSFIACLHTILPFVFSCAHGSLRVFSSSWNSFLRGQPQSMSRFVTVYVCVYVCKFLEEATNDNRTSDIGNTFTCTECDWKTNVAAHLTGHMIKHRKGQYACEQCHVTTITK